MTYSVALVTDGFMLEARDSKISAASYIYKQ